jgi:hypothetical protein
LSQVETTTYALIVSTGSRKAPDIQIVDKSSYRRNILHEKETWDTSLYSRIKPLRYSLFGNYINMDDQEDHNHVRHDEGEEVGNQIETNFWFSIFDTT